MMLNLIAAVLLAANTGWGIAFACLARYSADAINMPFTEQENWFWALSAISAAGAITNVHIINRRLTAAPAEDKTEETTR